MKGFLLFILFSLFAVFLTITQVPLADAANYPNGYQGDLYGDNNTVIGGVKGNLVGNGNNVQGGVTGCVVGDTNQIANGISGDLRGNNNIVTTGGVKGHVVGTGNTVSGGISNNTVPACPTPLPTPTATPTSIPTATPTPTPTPKFYTISGMVFNDANGNSQKDTGEENFAGKPSITATQGVVTANTDGTYTITNLTAGAVTISLNPPPTGYKMSMPRNGPPPSYQITVGPRCNTNGAIGASCQ